ncbi:MAG TPA: hypothetical protein VFH39_04515 [Candidatus Saccharimonadales bacterium]|nr:hypothetical protein [Candidatus Saccharimonadales bacterium]
MGVVTKKYGKCESCPNQADAMRYSNGIEVWKDENGDWKYANYLIKHPMCGYHQHQYALWMEAEKKKREKEAKQKRHGSTTKR